MLSERSVMPKGQILYDFLYVSFQKRQTHSDRKQMGGCQKPGGGDKADNYSMSTEFPFGAVKTFWN